MSILANEYDISAWSVKTKELSKAMINLLSPKIF